ncbi:MAG: molybdopterin molybdotransferase MoeA [Lentisphaerales bacterium]|nr:molybdopterin molybdotransferase MoeA [Lentisphaerales bacterium]
MVSVAEAEKFILNNIGTANVQSIPILQASGRVLAQEISAERDYPPFDRVTMDGIGINFESYASGNREFKITGTVGAGDEPQELSSIQTCLEVMTGAVCPPGVDCIIPVEMINVVDGVATIVEESSKISSGWNIHPQGSDCPAGTTLLKAGLTLNSASIAVAASEGAAEVKVFSKPKIAIISSGNELVALEESPEPWQIRRSNSFTIAAQLEALKLADVEVFHVQDEKEAITARFKELLADFDMLIMSGAVSKGKFDYIPEVLDSLGVEKLFHCVTQRPGKPFWFGVSSDKKPVFALPGNPVSTVAGFTRYIIPALYKYLGAGDYKPVKVSLNKDFKFKKSLTYFLPVKISQQGTQILAEPAPVNGSGDFSALAYTNGFVELPAELSEYPVGMEVDFYSWDKLNG